MARLVPEEALLLCIDYQEKLLPRIFDSDRIIENAAIMIEAAKILKMPIIVTEQYPIGLGRTDQRLRDVLGEYHPIEKTHFNCFLAQPFLESIKRSERLTLLIMGIESHICISQTALEALRKGFKAHVLIDTISSRTEENRKIGFERMFASGAIPCSVETAIYELLERSDRPEFKKVLRLVK